MIRIENIPSKPELWEKSVELFWNDKHISKGMLSAHLNPNTSAASRKPDVIERSIKWLTSVLPSKGKILDLGCGPGLYAKQLSNIGYDVTGVDFSHRSIEYALSQDNKTRYLEQDYLNLQINEQFDAVTLIYCDYSALVPTDRQILLANIAKVLKPNGILILDVFTPRNRPTTQEEKGWQVCPNGGFWNAQPHLCLESTYYYLEGRVSADQCIIVTDTNIHNYIIWDTTYTTQQLTQELNEGGFAVDSLWGDTCGNAYTDSSTTICAVSRKSK